MGQLDQLTVDQRALDQLLIFKFVCLVLYCSVFFGIRPTGAGPKLLLV